MGLQGEPHTSRGDLMRRLRAAENRIDQLETARRLEAAAIGAGGLTVKGGAIVILDDDGEERARLSTDGLTLAQLLHIVNGGQFLFEDGNGVRRVRISGRADDTETMRCVPQARRGD